MMKYPKGSVRSRIDKGYKPNRLVERPNLRNQVLTSDCTRTIYRTRNEFYRTQYPVAEAMGKKPDIDALRYRMCTCRLRDAYQPHLDNRQ